MTNDAPPISYATCKIIGPNQNHSGLGNQLFCVSTTYAYAKRHNKIPIFPDIITDPKVGQYSTLFYKNLNPGPDHSLSDFFSYKEESCLYAEIPFVSGNIHLKGYFQSEKYFNDFRNDIMHTLNVRELKKDIISKYGDFSDYTSIHIRRGDYLSPHYPLHNPLPVDYYMRAMTLMGAQNKFVFVSDDIEWCRNNFDIGKKGVFFEGERDYEDMILMSTCKNNIIANSSFSWWSAWMNEDPDKKVIAPQQWVGRRTAYGSSGIIPPSWRRI